MEIPGYTIQKTLGQGGMATVYLAIQESFQRKVAVKVMSAQLAQDPAFGDRFQREARIVSQMNHPNIVTVYDVGVVGNCHYLAMQFVEGKELRYRFNDMSLVERIKAVKDVAAALHYAGNKGYVHRDVKPENVMMSDEDGRAILMDFGIAKASDNNHSMTKTGTAIGTPYYMSPEQAQGKPVDKRSDLYSLGVMFFQLLTGYVPYDAESGVAIGIKHITEPVPLLPKHLRVFQPIIEKVMAKDPDKRYQAGAELIKDLDAIDLNRLDEVNQILHQEIHKANTTDPHAQTVLGRATPPPPILNTGNVTTADATRLAQRISAGELPIHKPKSKILPSLLAFVVVALVLSGGWYFLQKKNSAVVTPVAQGSDTATQESTLSPDVAQNTEEVIQPTVEPATTPQQMPAPLQDSVVSSAVEEKAQQEEQARLSAEQQKKEEELAKIAQEKARQEAAQKRKREEEQARSRADADAKAAAAREAKEKAQDAQRDEVTRRLNHAKALHEKGSLVTPENDNAVLAYRAVLEVDASNPTATLALKTIESNYLLGIRSLIEQDQLDQATVQLRSANKLYPNSAPINELLALHQEKQAAKEAAKVSATKPKVIRLVVNETAFDSVQLSQKTKLALGRNAFVGFSYENFQGATTLLQIVLYDSSRTVRIMQKPVVATGAAGQIFVTLARPVEGFPEGGYTVDLMSGDQRMASTSFMVGL